MPLSDLGSLGPWALRRVHVGTPSWQLPICRTPMKRIDICIETAAKVSCNNIVSQSVGISAAVLLPPSMDSAQQIYLVLRVMSCCCLYDGNQVSRDPKW